ncbi:hypothetical protein ACU5DF_03570 [Aliivibrio wodanis]|uniref:hypothetical protein n=1 Tax=Aliivibrio wodanis TaxID=80852 RepID=UPI00406C5BCB
MPEMSDWLSKKLSSIISIKQACIILLTCCLLILFNGEVTSLIKSKGGSDEYVSLLVFPVCCSFSYLSIEVFSLCYNRFIKVTKWLANLYKRRCSRIKFQENVSELIPQLPKEQIDILIQLIDSDKSIGMYYVNYLEKQHFVIRKHQVDRKSSIYGINPIVKIELQKYLSEKRREKIKFELSKLSQNERDFLSMFFSKQVECGTAESSVLMKNELYRAAENLVSKEILAHVAKSSKHNSMDKFCLASDVVNKLESEIFNANIIRDELVLDAKFIIVVQSSGDLL